MNELREEPSSVGAFIFARGGSKGLPGKNIRPLAGKPLIAYAIEVALQSNYVDRVIVSTDDESIAQVAREYGAEVPFMRPAHLASDTSSEWLSWQHALNYLQNMGAMPELFLSVPTTSPLRYASDLDACIYMLLKENHDMVVTASEAARNPYFNMVKVVDGQVEVAVKPDAPIVRRQDAPQFFDMTTVAYAAKSSFVLANRSVFDGSVGLMVVPEERALDIDTLLDFKIADFLMRERQQEMIDEKY